MTHMLEKYSGLLPSTELGDSPCCFCGYCRVVRLHPRHCV